MPIANATASHEQSMEALARANEIRLGRAQVKRDIHAGRKSLPTTLLDPPGCVDSALVEEIIRALPRFGAARARKLMHEAFVGPSRRVGNLTEREQKALVARLRHRGIS